MRLINLLLCFFALCFYHNGKCLGQGEGYEYPIVDSSLPQQIIKRTSYVCSYNKDLRCCNWVGWYLSADHAYGDVKRQNMPYIMDEDSVIGRQLLSDWTGTKGYDHGHMCPAADNAYDWEGYRTVVNFLLQWTIKKMFYEKKITEIFG